MNTQRNEKGFTLIELIVVIAIMGIIGAVLVPQFSTMSLRSRMSTDVSSIQAAQTQVEVYYNEKGTWPDGANGDAVITSLVSEDLIDSRYLSASKLKLQTDGATVSYDSAKHRLMVKVKATDYSKYNKTDDKGVWISN